MPNDATSAQRRLLVTEARPQPTIFLDAPFVRFALRLLAKLLVEKRLPASEQLWRNFRQRRNFRQSVSDHARNLSLCAVRCLRIEEVQRLQWNYRRRKMLPLKLRLGTSQISLWRGFCCYWARREGAADCSDKRRSEHLRHLFLMRR